MGWTALVVPGGGRGVWNPDGAEGVCDAIGGITVATSSAEEALVEVVALIVPGR